MDWNLILKFVIAFGSLATVFCTLIKYTYKAYKLNKCGCDR